MIASLVYSLVSCCAVRPSVVANPGEREATESFNKRLWAGSSQVTTPSPRLAHTHTQLLLLKGDR